MILGWILLAAWAEDSVGAITASLTVAVANRDAAADAIVADAEAHGGWFALRTPPRLTLRVPVADVEPLVATIVAQGRVLRKDLTREDRTRSIAEVEGRIEARQKVLERYDEALGRADPTSITQIERRILTVIGEIESLTGRLQVLEHDAAYARVEVEFQFRDRTAPAADQSSTFAWVDALDLRTTWMASRGQVPWRTRGVGATAPAGFAGWRGRGFGAISADDVTYRVVTARHWPRADLAFWQEAVREHLSRAGYTVVSEGPVEADGQAGALIELAAPMGTEDWTWMVAFFPAGRRIVIAEAAGPIPAVDGHRAAIVESIEGLVIR